MKRLMVRAPIGPFMSRINRDLRRLVREQKPDVVLFDKPTHFTKKTILEIRHSGALTVCYNQDNPFGPRKDPGWYQFRKVFPLFDLHCAIRETDVVRFREWGLNWVKVMFSFEPTMNFPPPQGWSDADRSRDVSYIGSPYEERPEFLRRLGEEYHIPVTIAGTTRWKDFLPPDLFARYVLDGPLFDSEYREAMWRSRINVSFVTRLNEDDISHKSIEIAACQGFLLARRCEGHQAIFEEDKEAVFFSSVEECAEKCRFYLGHPALREEIARRGRERAVRSGYDNDTQLSRILNHLDGSDVA
ncbi:MAG TPA: glycosyltransferase [Acidobacteriaceae bacterium]|nr:glycosyltransferase [Acidobacteriaceae bacterium]